MKARVRCLSVLGLLAVSGAAFGIDVTRPGDFIEGSSTNYPAAESPPNAIDNTASTKYLNFDEINTGFTVIPSGSGTVNYITIITANDAPPRDPTSFLLEGSDDGTTFATIASGALTPAIDRFSISSSARFDNSTTYGYYRVTFPTVRDSGGANSMQVAEVQLTNVVDITSPEDPVSITLPEGATTAPNEGVDKLFDNKLGTKLDVQGAQAGQTIVDITPLAGSSVITGFSYSSGSDDFAFPGRTPQSITLMGSNNGVDFAQIFTTPLVSATNNFEDQEFEFSNSTAYTQYRIVLDVPFFDTDMQVGDLQLYGTASTLPPANDDCANASAITAGTFSGTTTLASGSDVSSCGSGDTADVWYRYTAGSSGLVEVNTRESTRDTVLTVYSSCGGAEIACDDNGSYAQSVVRFNATAGSSYLIRVALNNGDTGAFRITLIENAETHTDVAVPLAYNFNGMVHTGEAGLPDDPNGYRSISDRGLVIDSSLDSLGVGGIIGNTGIHYEVVQQAGALDIVHLGDRNVTDNGNHVFDAVPDGDEVGIQPDWLPDTNQTGPQTSTLPSGGIVLGPNTAVGVLYQASNGGAFCNFTLGFSDLSSVDVFLEAPDWFFDQSPGIPNPGVAAQAQLGVFRGAENVDMADPGASLNVVEAVVTVQQLMTDGFGDFTGRTLTSLTVSGSTSSNAAFAFIAATVRDGQPSCTADFNNDGMVNSQDFFDFLTAFFSSLPNADFNHDGNINSQDFFDFLTAFFAGC